MNDLKQQVLNLVGEQYRYTCPPETMVTTVTKTDQLSDLVVKTIAKANRHSTDKIQVSRHGKVRDENGQRVEAFCFNIGMYVVADILYKGIVVDMLDDRLNILLVRSDAKKSMHALFPNLGTAQDWTILQKCAKRFSPKWASKRIEIDIVNAQTQAASANAMSTLSIAGQLNRNDLDVLSGMSPQKLQLIDLCAAAASYTVLPEALAPEFVHVLRTETADDLDEIRRAMKGLDLTTPLDAVGRDTPIFQLIGKGGLSCWQKARCFIPLTYEKASFGQHVLDMADQARTEGVGKFVTTFPCLPVLIGSRIWSDRACTEIDVRGLRLSSKELEVGRRLIATLLVNSVEFIQAFEREWNAFWRNRDTLTTSYDRAWFICWHFAAAQILFSAYDSRREFADLCAEADSARLRLRDNRTNRYAVAIGKLGMVMDNAPWLMPTKPRTKSEALEALKGRYDAFRHTVKERPVMCFSKESFIRFTGIEAGEVDDFVLKLKGNHLMEHKTHPVSFAKQEQGRFFCVYMNSITVTANEEERGA